MCKHLIREYLTLSSYELQLFVSFPVSGNVIHRRTETERQGRSEEEHMFASVWSLKGASPPAARAWAFVRCSLPF